VRCFFFEAPAGHEEELSTTTLIPLQQHGTRVPPRGQKNNPPQDTVEGKNIAFTTTWCSSQNLHPKKKQKQKHIKM
jgi:hypothetical protein